MAPMPVPILRHRRAGPWAARLAVLALVLAGLLVTSPARAQVLPPANPLGFLVWASEDGSQVHAYGDLYSVSGLDLTWETAEPRAGEENVRHLDFPISEQTITFRVRFTAFQFANLNRVISEQMNPLSPKRGTWYVVFKDLALSGGAGTYMYWKLSGELLRFQRLFTDSGTNAILDVQTFGGAEGVNSCVVTRSGASGACVLPTAYLAVVLPRPVVDQPTWVQVTARDVLGQRVRSYLGRVHFTATRPSGAAVKADLPGDFTFRPRNAGNRVFNNGVVFHESGRHQLTVQDTANPSLRGRVGFDVRTPVRTTTTSTSTPVSP